MDYRISQLDDCQTRIESDRHHQKIEQALKQLFFRLGVADHIRPLRKLSFI
ncbi:hypothetical protein [Candidatus Regiella insecticola]|uniref:hypothetical protein n=1 Tax=Candidatus Regiella insecticola TaxID=138073 RepID=UPI0002F76719|nr:hypothetical protein [Candidatus Regiella insecticola]